MVCVVFVMCVMHLCVVHLCRYCFWCVGVCGVGCGVLVVCGAYGFGVSVWCAVWCV